MLASQQHYLEKLARELFKNGYSEDKVIDVLIREKNNFKIFKPQLSFKDFVIPLQKELEPKWTYKEDFFQYVINDYSHFLDKRRSDLFLLEAPPRTGKTELITGFGIPYLLATQSNKRILIICGNQALKRKLRKVIVRVVKSDYYKNKYKKYLTINNSSEIQTNDGNLVLFTTTSSEVPTGEGFHYIVLEDPLTHTMIRSEAKREDAFEQIDGCLTRTQDDPATQVILNSQRLNCEDFNQRIVNRYSEAKQSITRLTMPYYFKDDVIIKDAVGNEYNFKQGQFLIKRFDQDKKDKIVAKIGLDAFETQYQQNPQINEGAILQPYDLSHVYESQSMEMASNKYFEYILVSCDTAEKAGKYNDNSCFTVAGVKNGIVYVLDVITIKAEFSRLVPHIENIYWKYNPDYFLIEDKSSGTALISYFNENPITNPQTGYKYYIKPYPTKPERSKLDRLLKVIHFFQTKRVLVPEYADWLLEWKNELLSFPNGKHDDRVDSLTHLLDFIATQYMNRTQIYNTI